MKTRTRAIFFAALLLATASSRQAYANTIVGQDCHGQNLICDGATAGCGGITCHGAGPNNDFITGTFTNVGLFEIPNGDVVYVLQGQPLIIYASTINVSGVIDAGGAGGAGGGGGTGSPTDSGTNGFGASPGTAGPYFSSGGSVNAGGGGGYGGAGGAGSVHNGSGSTPGQGGVSTGSVTLDVIPLSTASVNMGSGGGGGTGQQTTCPGTIHNGGGGGFGGGSVYLEASSITVAGAILVNGDAGNDGVNSTACTWTSLPSSSGPGAGGGGSGGGILLRAHKALDLWNDGNAFAQGLQASGGNSGGADGPSVYGGGGGGGGRIKLFSEGVTTLNNIAISTAEGIAVLPSFGDVNSSSGIAGSSGTVFFGQLASSPTGVGFSQVNVGSITWTWNAPSSWGDAFTIDASSANIHYNVYGSTSLYSFSEGGIYYYMPSRIPQISPSSATIAVVESGLSANTSYYRYVTAFTDYGDSFPSASTGVWTLAFPPSNPYFYQAATGSLTIDWSPQGNPVNSPNSPNYITEIATTSAFSSIIATLQSTNTYANPGSLNPDSTYYARVQAVNGAGVFTSFTSVISTSTLALAPTGANFSAVYYTSMTLLWSSNGNLPTTLYTAEISTDNFADILANFSINSTSVVFTGLSPGTAYYGRVKTTNNDGVDTAYADAPPSGTLVEGPTAVTPTYTNIGLTTLTANWSANGNPPNIIYIVMRSTDSSFSVAVSTSYETGVSSSPIGLSLNTTYYFEVGSGPPPYLVLGGGATLVNNPVNVALHFPTVGLTSFTFAWGAHGNPSDTLYDAELSTNNFQSFSADSSTYLTSASFVGLATNTVYAAHVYATNVEGVESANHSPNISTSTLVGTPANILSPFSNLSASGFTFTWDPAGDPGGTDFVVQIATIANFSVLTASASTLAFSQVFSGLSANTSYYAEVQAVNYDGIPSAFAPSTATVTFTLAPLLASQPFSNVYPSSFTFSWSLGGNPAGTLFDPEISNDGFATIAASYTVSAISYIFTNLLPNTTYEARVAGINSAGIAGNFAGPVSTASLAYIPQPDTPPMEPSGTGVFINWSVGSNPLGTDYALELSTDPAFSALAATAATTAQSQAILNLTTNATYYGRVQALNYEGVPTAWLSAGSTITYAAAISPASVTGSTATGVVDLANFSFSNNISTGIGGLSFYRWVFDVNSTHLWDDSESTWTPTPPGLSPTAFLYTTATINGYWTLHLKSYNSSGAGLYTTDISSYDVRVSSVLPPSNVVPTSRYVSGAAASWNWNAAVSYSGAVISSYVVSVATSPTGFASPVATNTITGSPDAPTNYTFNATQNGMSYYLSVYGIDAGGVQSPPATSSQGVLVDQTPPSIPGVPQPNVQFSYDGSILFSWTPSTDTISGINSYLFDLGTTPGGNDILNAVAVGTAAYYTASSLATNKTYYARVKASNNAGVIGDDSGISFGVPVWIAATAQPIKAMGWPNPFNPKSAPVQIGFYMEASGSVNMKIYTLEGRLVFSESKNIGSMGNQVIPWSGENGGGRTVAPGGYIVIIDKNAGGKTEQETFKIAVLY